MRSVHAALTAPQRFPSFPWPWARATILALSFGAVSAALAAEAPLASFRGATPVEWSTRLARSEMQRRGDSLFFGAPNARWDYSTALFGQALVRLADARGEPPMAEYGFKIAESYVADDGTIRTYHEAEYNLDMVTPGKLLLWRFQRTRDDRFRKPIEALRQQLTAQPRTSEGGFWHKQRYPYQMWLDGLFMASPFLAEYAQTFEHPADFDEVARQLLLVDRHTYDAKAGLHYHAWDERKAQAWADKTTGQSPNFWARAQGWYAMALVDVLDYLPPTHRDVDHVSEILRRVAAGVARYQDPKTGLWWQVLDQGDRAGNYREASASSMFVYALAKAVNRGYLPRETYAPVVQRGYEGIVRDLIRVDADNSVSLTQCCSVAGLGYTSSSGRPRDGTFEYYISEPIIDNDLKGVGPFILAGIEVQALLSGRDEPAAVRGWHDVEALVSRIAVPSFPTRDFPITDFGAKPGADATAAVQAAINACHQAGGGRVVVPAGEWLTAALRLRSRVNLHVSAGATLRWIFAPEKYPVVFTRWEGVECMNYSAFIYALDEENIAITGEGTLDGAADWDNWWSWNDKRQGIVKQKAARTRLLEQAERGVPVEQRVFGEGSFLRPNFIQPYRCKNVLIEGVTILRSPMWEIHPVLCDNVTVRRVSIKTHGPNNDGCDPESSRNVLIEDCVFDTGDDCIAIKSGRNADGRRLNRPTENVVIRRCTMKDGHGGVVLGSECSGGIRNVFVEDCTMDSPQLDRALRFKSNAARGGILENVWLRRVKVGRVSEAVLTIDLQYEEGARGDFPPVVRGVHLDHVSSDASPRVLFIRGFPAATIDDIRLTDCTFNSVTTADVVEHANRLTFERVSVLSANARSLNSVPASVP